MNQYPLIPPLETRQVKELLRQIRVMRSDYPALGPDDLADEWESLQRYQATQGGPAPYAEWLDGDRWREGFRRAVAFAERQRELKQKAKAQRQQWKDVRRDREPATPRQVSALERLAKRQDLTLAQPPAELSKLAASRLIEQLRAETSS